MVHTCPKVLHGEFSFPRHVVPGSLFHSEGASKHEEEKKSRLPWNKILLIFLFLSRLERRVPRKGCTDANAGL